MPTITADQVLFLARSVLGIVMIYYGWPKVKNLRSNAGDFVKMGFGPGILWGTLIALVEFLGGISAIAGFYAELAASLFGFQMIVGAFWKLKIKKKFPDYSYDLLLLAICVIIMFHGAGSYAIAHFDASIFLNWYVASGAMIAGAIMAYSSKMQAA